MNILLTGGGAPGAAGIIKCLRNGNPEIQITCVDINPYAYGQVLADKFYTVPGAGDQKFISEIKNICEKESIDIIIPLVTRELSLFAANKHNFYKLGINICVQDAKILHIINDKYKLLATLQRNGLQTPEFYLCNDVDQFEKACEKLGYPEKTVCFKPALSNGSRGFRVLSRDIDEFRLLFEEKPNTAYIHYESAINLFIDRVLPNLVVMEYLPGPEWSVDCLVDNGSLLYCIPRLRNRMNGGISIDATTVQEPSIIDFSERICRMFKLNGNIGIQFKQDINGLPQILEINPRLQGSIVISVAAGVNLPYYGILLCSGQKVPQVEPQWGIRMCRYWEEVYFDANGQSFTYPFF
ncbi:ATP-grasp domain-containing protein [Breznakiella homolactica]|uniref:ATP-grasp domain-containing protein n=1 Tax=Breznakiella homolactica TaxID=2798577 RepID=A0A7T7XNZ5_9SPIR|nr:ATP-grasp domain-containing protein [Breznakiella homolactica]QQO09826.1 ATP-grasp domain-containing protein [Breznakiella homolactica]